MGNCTNLIYHNRKKNIDENNEDEEEFEYGRARNMSNISFNRKERKKYKLIVDKKDKELYENFQIIDKKIEINEIMEIIKVFKNHFVFYSLSQDELLLK